MSEREREKRACKKEMDEHNGNISISAMAQQQASPSLFD
jgi:hypothetical protein